MQFNDIFWIQAGAALHGYGSSGDSSHPDKQTLAARGHCIANEGGPLPLSVHPPLRSDMAQRSAGPALHHPFVRAICKLHAKPS